MRHLYLCLLCITITIVVGCVGHKDPTKNYYYLVIEDLAEIDPSNSVVISEIIEAQSDSEAINTALIKITSHLYGEANVSFFPSAITKMKPHEFIINIFGKDGVLINPTSQPELSSFINWLADRTIWTENDNYVEAIEYYRNNTNVFSDPHLMFANGKKYASKHCTIFNPADKLENKYAESVSKNRPLPDVTTAIIIAIILILLICVPYFKHKHKTQLSKKSPIRPTIKMLNREGDTYEDEWHTYIAGLSHYASKHNCGGFTGWIAVDSTNEYDANAMGIYNSFGKLLGYIPAKELSDYRLWSNAKPHPCVGFIFVEDDQIRGRVKILKPCNVEFLQTEFNRYLQWVNDNYGPEYLPPKTSLQFNVE